VPHIYHEAEIVELLAAARGLNPQDSLRPITFETLFGLIASAGLRVSEALSLLDNDVDLSDGTLLVRQTKFAKSRLLPLHPSTVEVLVRYRQLRSRQVQTTADTPFFIGTRAIDWVSPWALAKSTGSSNNYGISWAGWIAVPMAILASTTCATASLSAG